MRLSSGFAQKKEEVINHIYLNREGSFRYFLSYGMKFMQGIWGMGEKEAHPNSLP